MIELSETPVQPVPVPTPSVSVPWFASKTFAAMCQTTVLTTLLWLTTALASNKWEDWQTALALPIVSNLFILFRDLWSTTITAPLKFLNVNNAPEKIAQIQPEK